MKTSAAAILLVGMVMAATVAAHAQRARSTSRASEVEPGGHLGKRIAILVIEDARNPTSAELQFLIDAARNSSGSRDSPAELELRRIAVRALGRFERRDLIPALTGFLQDAQLRQAAELGLLLTLRAHPSANLDKAIDDAVNHLIPIVDNPRVLGQLPYARADQFEAVDARLRAKLNDVNGPREGAARALEALARRNRRLGRLSDETIVLLKKGATRTLPHMTSVDTPLVLNSMAALVAAGVVDEDLIEASFRVEAAEVRRLGALALYGAASLDPVRRTDLTQNALKDRAASVRYEALRAWARRETPQHGCGPILLMLADESEHVALAAIDALGERCTDDDSISDRLATELREPPVTGPWHREAHALLALARRAPDRAAMAMPMFSKHSTWQVRMYAARAAALLKDADTLAALAYDNDDNVRHAALPPLRVLKGADSDDAFVAALGRDDYQLLRTVAITLRGAAPNKYVLAALAGALERVTAQKNDTSRDTRLALIERIVEQGPSDHARVFERLSTDFDPRIAHEAATVLTRLTGRTVASSPRPLPRPVPPTKKELEEAVVARVQLDNGRSLDIELDRGIAPLAYVRFARLVRSNYYDGLTFHRVVPNFVVQGGSPRANEYGGDALFMRDELDYSRHLAGTVGISTRGRDTGDAQLFINLVDNARLDFEYTVVGRVVRGDGVDSIQEGTRIRHIRMVPPSRTR